MSKGATSETGKYLFRTAGGGVHIILLLPLVAKCLETIDVCIWRMFVFMYVVVTVFQPWSVEVCCSDCFSALEC